MPKVEGLPREPTSIDHLGRVVIPKRFREAMGLPEGEKAYVWVEAYPSGEDCRAVLVRRVETVSYTHLTLPTICSV